jgi:hypothetical protein
MNNECVKTIHICKGVVEVTFVKFDPFLRSVLLLLVIANDPSSSILVTLMMEAISSSETSLTIDTRRDIQSFFIVTAVKASNFT